MLPQIIAGLALAPKLLALYELADARARKFGHADGLIGWARWLGHGGSLPELALAARELVTPDIEPIPRCGVKDIQRSGVCKWSSGKLRVHWDLAGLPAWCDEEFGYGLGILESACGVTLDRTTNKKTAHIWAAAARIDGKGGTLAWSFLPCPEPMVLPGLEQRYDSDDSALISGREFFRDVVAHETAHALGLDHNNDPASLLYPSIRPRLRGLAATDPAALALADRYGPATAPVPVPPVDPPPPVPPTPAIIPPVDPGKVYCSFPGVMFGSPGVPVMLHLVVGKEPPKAEAPAPKPTAKARPRKRSPK